MDLSDGQVTALENLYRKLAGEDVGWISIADARALSDLGLAERNPAGWNITAAGQAWLHRRRTGAPQDARADLKSV